MGPSGQPLLQQTPLSSCPSCKVRRPCRCAQNRCVQFEMFFQKGETSGCKGKWEVQVELIILFRTTNIFSYQPPCHMQCPRHGIGMRGRLKVKPREHQCVGQVPVKSQKVCSSLRWQCLYVFWKCPSNVLLEWGPKPKHTTGEFGQGLGWAKSAVPREEIGSNSFQEKPQCIVCRMVRIFKC